MENKARKTIVRSLIVILTLFDLIVLGLLTNHWFDSAQVKPATFSPPTEAAAPVLDTPALPVVPPAANQTSPTDCPPPQQTISPIPPEVRITTWGKSIPASIIDCFEARVGTQVKLVEHSSVDDFLAQMANKETGTDIIVGADFFLEKLISIKRLATLDQSRLKIFSNINPSFLKQQIDPTNRYFVPQQAELLGFAVNTDKVQTPPTSWKDLWEPTVAERLSVPDNSRFMVGITLITLSIDPSTKVESHLERTREPLTHLLKAGATLESDGSALALSEGKVDIAVTTSSAAALAKRANPAIEFSYPTEGAFYYQSFAALASDAKNVDAAYAWLNYTNQNDVAWHLLQDVPATLTNDAAINFARQNVGDVYDEYINSEISNPPFTIVSAATRLLDVGEFAAQYSKLWKEVVEAR